MAKLNVKRSIDLIVASISAVLLLPGAAAAQGGSISASPNPYEIEDTIQTDYHGSWNPFDPVCQYLYGSAEFCYSYYGYTQGNSSWGGGAGYGEYLGYGQPGKTWTFYDSEGSFYPSVT